MQRARVHVKPPLHEYVEPVDKPHTVTMVTNYHSKVFTFDKYDYSLIIAHLWHITNIFSRNIMSFSPWGFTKDEDLS